MNKTERIRRLQRLRQRVPGEDVAGYDGRIAQLRKEIVADSGCAHPCAMGYSGEEEFPLSFVSQRARHNYKRGYEEGQKDLQFILGLESNRPRGCIRKRSRDSWHITVYTGEKENGKKARYFETVRGTRLDAENRLRELHSEGVCKLKLTPRQLDDKSKIDKRLLDQKTARLEALTKELKKANEEIGKLNGQLADKQPMEAPWQIPGLMRKPPTKYG